MLLDVLIPWLTHKKPSISPASILTLLFLVVIWYTPHLTKFSFGLILPLERSSIRYSMPCFHSDAFVWDLIKWIQYWDINPDTVLRYKSSTCAFYQQCKSILVTSSPSKCITSNLDVFVSSSTECCQFACAFLVQPFHWRSHVLNSVVTSFKEDVPPIGLEPAITLTSFVPIWRLKFQSIIART